MISRRDLLFGTSAGLLFPKRLLAQDEEWKKALEASIRNKDTVTLGHILPPVNDKSWTEAHDILAGAPIEAAPYRIAEYFVTSVPAKYQMSWPEPSYSHPTYANPVIVLFFLATKLDPAGDTTAWCAAFANWCIQRAGLSGTMSAGSQSFRNWGQAVWSNDAPGLPTQARMGDIVVFRSLSKPGFGHVAFFKQISTKQPNSIEILGGNQIRGSGPNQIHLIDVATLRVDGDLQLYAIRTQEGLRNV